MCSNTVRRGVDRTYVTCVYVRVCGDVTQGTAGHEAEAGMEMSALVNYIQPVHFHSFEHAESKILFRTLSSCERKRNDI